MHIRLNGQHHPLGQNIETVTDLLATLGVGERIVMVERNGVVLDREYHAKTSLQEGDHIEVVRFVGGG